MEWREGEVPGTYYGLSNKDWVDTELFRGWLTDHFIEHAVGIQPLTTHESRPLDTSVFKPLKQNWQDACHDYIQLLQSTTSQSCYTKHGIKP